MLAALGVTDPFDRHHRLVSSPLYSPRTLALQRLALVVYGAASLITSLVYESVVLHQGHIWFSFFTYLTYIGLFAYLLASTYHGFKYRPFSPSCCAYPLQHWHTTFQALHLLLMSTVTTFPFLVTICFWALLSSAATFQTRYSTWTAVSFHILNIVFALLEILTTNMPPLPWMALPVCLVILLAYLGVAYITHATEGVYTYDFLNPQTQHGKLAAYILGIAVLEVIIFVLVRYVIVLRDKVSRFDSYHDSEDSHQQGPKEELDEWEQVQWNGGERRESGGGLSTVEEEKGIGIAS